MCYYVIYMTCSPFSNDLNVQICVIDIQAYILLPVILLIFPFYEICMMTRLLHMMTKLVSCWSQMGLLIAAMLLVIIIMLDYITTQMKCFACNKILLICCRIHQQNIAVHK